MRVCEIFESIDGEGIRTGYPVVFVRLHGCNLSCNYCDSRYACVGQDYTDMSVDDIVEKVNSSGLHRVTLTGGEPLLRDDVLDLIDELTIENEVNIETNGSIDLSLLDSLKNGKDNVIVTMDYKCKGSDMDSYMIKENFSKLGEKDVLKFVVSHMDDLEDMKQIIQDNDIRCSVFVSPVFGRIDPCDIAEYIVQNKLTQCRVQVQLHKVLWDPNMRGV